MYHCWMHEALKEAYSAKDRGEVPVGAVLVHNKAVLVRDGNRMRELDDPTQHAEIRVIHQAIALRGRAIIEQCDLYVTLEPCTMCAGAIALARVQRLYYGAYDVKMGAVDHGMGYFQQSICHHNIDVYAGIKQQECEAVLHDFFKPLRD